MYADFVEISNRTATSIGDMPPDTNMVAASRRIRSRRSRAACVNPPPSAEDLPDDT
jgi:hypothetical protein